MKTSQITENLFSAGITCEKKMYLSVNHSELGNRSYQGPSSVEIAEFKNLTKKLLAPNGISIPPIYSDNNLLKKILGKRSITIYDLEVNHRDMYGTIDILTKHGDCLDIFILIPEIEITDLSYYKAAFDVYCLKQVGITVNHIYLTHVNKEYVKSGELTAEITKMFDATKSIYKMLGKIGRKVDYFAKVLHRSEAPTKDVGEYCLKPNTCQFKDHCWNALPSNNIFELRSMQTTRKLGLYYKDIDSLEKLVNTKTKLNEVQTIQVASTLNNQVAYRKDEIGQWIFDLLKCSHLYFMDFETIAPIVPVANGTSPSQKVPFQFSIHRLKVETGEITQWEFLAEPEQSFDSREEFLVSLLSKLPLDWSSSKILVYNKSFENSILAGLKKDFQVYSKQITNIQNNIVDMMIVFKDCWYYDPRFHGSYSLKKILPVLCPDISYDNLKISEGTQASNIYRELIDKRDNEKKNIRQGLLDYCRMDTYAMVRIFEFLKLLIECEHVNEDKKISNYGT